MKKQIKKLNIHIRRETGFTLAELAIVIVVSGILIASSVPFFKINVDSYVKVRQGKDILQSSRIAFNRMMSELHKINDPLGIAYGSSSRIDFNVPNDGWGYITYRERNGRIERESRKLIDYVQDFTIRYYRADGSQKNTPFWYDSDVWRIQLEIVVGDGENNYTLRGQVSPRNIHY